MAGLAGLDGQMLANVEQPTRHGKGAPVLGQIEEIVAELCQTAGVERSRLAQVTIGVPAAVDPVTGLASLSPNLELDPTRPLAVVLGERLGCRVNVENDVNVAAFGEAVLGHGRGTGALALISFGTGAGMGLVIGGKMVRGVGGRTGEIAYLPLGGDAYADEERTKAGLYELAVGSPGFRGAYSDDGTSVFEIFERATKGEAKAQAVIEQVARTGALGLASVVALIDPDVVVLAGSIGARQEFADLLKANLAKLLPFPVRVEVSALGREAGLHGAVQAAVAAARDGAN